MESQIVFPIYVRPKLIRHCTVCNSTEHRSTFHNPPRTHRKCPHCKDMLPVDHFYCRLNKDGTYLAAGYCKKCDWGARQTRYEIAVANNKGAVRILQKNTTERKVCSRCTKDLPISEYTVCLRLDSGKQYYRSFCKSCANSRSKKIRKGGHKSRLESLLRSARWRAKSAGIPFNLDIGFVMDKGEKQGWRCFYSKEPMTHDGTQTSVSLDRVIPERGYTKDNVVLVMWVVNHMKKNLSAEYFKKLCKQIGES